MNNKYCKRQGTSGIRGQLYETKLLSLINFRFLHYDDVETFHLATNVDKIGSFDDICFKIKLKGENPFFVFIQAKHKENIERLFSYKTDILKNFNSYLTIRYKFEPTQKDVLFKGNFDETQCLFVMYSNARNELTDLDESSITDTLNELIGTGPGGNVKKPLNSAEDVKYLCGIIIKKQINQLARRMIPYITDEYHFSKMLSDELVRRYHVIMRQKVFDISDIFNAHDPDQQYRIATFRQEFFDNHEEHIILFKEALYTQILKKRKLSDDDKHNLEEYLKNPLDVTTLSKLIVSVISSNNGQLQIVKRASSLKDFRQKVRAAYVPQLIINKAIELAAKEILEAKKFKVPTSFGNKDLTMRKRRRLNYVAEKLSSLLKESETNEITIDEALEDEEGFLKLNGGIASAVGNLLVLDKDPKYMKFTDNCEELEVWAKILFQILKERFENLQEYKFNFKVRVFPTLNFGCFLHEELLAKDFLNKLRFFTNQSDEAGVGKQLKREIEDEQYNHLNNFFVNTDVIYLKYHNEMQTWWITAKEAPYLTKNSKIFKNVLDDILKDRLMSHVTYMTNMNKTKCLNYTFENDVMKCIKLQLQTQSILIAENCDMLLAKVIQYLNHLKEGVIKNPSSVSKNTSEKQTDGKILSSDTNNSCEKQKYDKKLSSNTNDKTMSSDSNSSCEKQIYDKKLSSNTNDTCEKQIHDKTLSSGTKTTCEKQIDDKIMSSDTNSSCEKQIYHKKFSSNTNDTCKEQIHDKTLSSGTKTTCEKQIDDKIMSSDTNSSCEKQIYDKKLSSNTNDTCEKQIHDKTLSSGTKTTCEKQIDDKIMSSDTNSSCEKQIYHKKFSSNTNDTCKEQIHDKTLSSGTKTTCEKQIDDKIMSSDTNSSCEKQIYDKKLSSNDTCEKQIHDKTLSSGTKNTHDKQIDDKILSSDTNNSCEKQIDDKKLSSDTHNTCEKQKDNKKKSRKKKFKNLDLEYIILDFRFIMKLLPNEFEALRAELSNTDDKKLLIFVSDDIQNTEHLRKSLKVIAKSIGHKKIIFITNENSVDTIQKYFIQTAAVVSDDKHGIIDLIAKSQKSMLENSKVIFQGKEVSLDLILDGKSMKYVKGEVLNCVIQQKTIVIGKAIGNKDYDKTSYIDGRLKSNENGAVVKTLYDIDDDVVVVTGKPGMGKSTLLTHLSLETKKIDPKVWIVRINLLKHSSMFSKWKNDNIDTLKTLEFMCQVILYEKFGKKHDVHISLEEEDGVVQLKGYNTDEWTVFELQLFLHYYYRKNIIFLFDGFDEIYSRYKTEVLDCLKCVRNCPQKHKTWITSRPYNEIESILRKDFGNPHEMEPLSYKQRDRYLEKFWKSNLILNQFDSEQLDSVYDFIKYMSESENRERLGFTFEQLLHEIYVSAGLYLVNEIKHTHIPLWKYESNNDDSYYIEEISDMYTECFDDESTDGTPLLLHLTADYFQSLIKAKRETLKWNLDINTFDIYEKYLEKKLKIRVEEKYGADICMPDFNNDYEEKLAKLILKHKQIGAYAIFSEFSEKLFTKKELKKIMNTIKFIEKADNEETGHICKVANGIPIFSHMIFTEYYAVEYISDLLKNRSRREKQHSMLDFIFNVVLVTVDLSNVHSLFDHKLKTDQTLKNVLLENKDYIFDILLKQGKKHSEYIMSLRKKHSSTKGNKSTRIIQGKQKNTRTTYNYIHEWALSESISRNLHNVTSLFMSIFKSNLNVQNVDVFLDILVGTNVLVLCRANVCDEFLIFILDFVRENAKSKLHSMVTNNFPYLCSLKNYEEMESKDIIKLIQEEYMNEYIKLFPLILHPVDEKLNRLFLTQIK